MRNTIVGDEDERLREGRFSEHVETGQQHQRRENELLFELSLHLGTLFDFVALCYEISDNDASDDSDRRDTQYKNQLIDV